MAKEKKEKNNKNDIQEIKLLETETEIVEIETVIEDNLEKAVEKIEDNPFEVVKFNAHEIINNNIVKEIQLSLKELGYNINTLGNYDKTTYGAVCDYKRKNKYKEVNGDINERFYKDLIVDKTRE